MDDRKSILGSVSESVASFFGKRTKTTMVTPPHLHSAVRFPYGPFQFKFLLPKGVAYEIQATINLEGWQPVLEGKSGDGPVDYVDSDASKFSYRFYRVLAERIQSDNVIGYATINVAPGYSMIANPLEAPSNTVSSILPGMPEGAALNKFDTLQF